MFEIGSIYTPKERQNPQMTYLYLILSQIDEITFDVLRWSYNPVAMIHGYKIIHTQLVANETLVDFERVTTDFAKVPEWLSSIIGITLDVAKKHSNDITQKVVQEYALRDKIIDAIFDTGMIAILEDNCVVAHYHLSVDEGEQDSDFFYIKIIPSTVDVDVEEITFENATDLIEKMKEFAPLEQWEKIDKKTEWWFKDELS